MKKLLVTLLVLALIAGAAFVYWKFLYSESPGDAFLRTASCAMLGDEAGFLDGFTDDSRPLMAGLLALARADDVRSSARHPYYYLVTENVEGVDVDGDRAVVKLRRMGDKAIGTRYDVALAKVGNSWKIDAFSFTGKEFAANRNR
ncbi:MAG: hypothetical protein EXR79_08570 [Myxococcales bacterium]|nr:hypothetical protein [Myxococcales bacterium]